MYNNTPLPMCCEGHGLQRFGCGLDLGPLRIAIWGTSQPRWCRRPLSKRYASPHACTRLAPLLLRCAEGGWLRPQAEEALLEAAEEGDLATLTRLLEEGVEVKTVVDVSAAPPAAPRPLRPSPSALAARRPSPPPLTACGAAAVPPQSSSTALMHAAGNGNLDCLEHLIAKGANVNAQSGVRRGPAAAWRRGVWG